MELREHVAIVTGASRGLGRAIALGLGRAGALVALAARDARELNTVATQIEQHGGQALVVRCDVRDPDAVQALVQRTLQTWGRIDSLINSAGIAVRQPALELPLSAWHEVLDTLLTGTFLATQAVLPSMIAARRGNIVNLLAPLDAICVPGFSAYAAAKWGVAGLTQTLAKELRRYGINVNGLHPGGFADTGTALRTMPAALHLASLPPRSTTGTTVDARRWFSAQTDA